MRHAFRFKKYIAALMMIGFMLGSGLQLAEAAKNAPVRMAPLNFSDLADTGSPAVVHIKVEKTVKRSGRTLGPSNQNPFGGNKQFKDFFGRHFGQQRQPEFKQPGQGSGFIVDKSGYIVTNNHVVDDANDVRVILNDGTKLEARVVGRDSKTDLALLKVEARQPLPSVQFGNSDDARVGDWVLAVGNPFGLGGSVTAGIISARGRDIRSGPFDDFLQVDAPINRGNSGGPLFDHTGKVVGVNTAIFSPSGGSVGIGFAIPARMAASVVEQLKDKGTVSRGYIGVHIQEVSEELAESFQLSTSRGALIASVGDGSPAEKAGLDAGDVVLSFDGEAIESVRELPRVVAAIPAGSRVPVTIWRNGKERNVKLEVGRMPGQEKPLRTSSALEPAAGDTARLGVLLAPLDERGKRDAGIPDADNGVLVHEVQPGGPAARQGLRAGDVILQVGSTPVSDPSQVADAVREADRTQRGVVLLVRRDGNERFVAVPFHRG